MSVDCVNLLLLCRIIWKYFTFAAHLNLLLVHRRLLLLIGANQLLFGDRCFSSVGYCTAELGLTANITAASLIIFQWNVGIWVFLIIVVLKIEIRRLTKISISVVIFIWSTFFALLLQFEWNYSRRFLCFFDQINKFWRSTRGWNDIYLLLLLVWLLNSLLYASYERSIDHFSIAFSFLTTFANTSRLCNHFFNELLIVIISTYYGCYFSHVSSVTILFHFRS